MKKKKENHRATNTQIESYKECLESNIISLQEQRVLEYLGSQETPRSSRQISTDTHIERSSITRTLYNLLNKGKIYIAKIDKCPITGRKVQFYTLVVEM